MKNKIKVLIVTNKIPPYRELLYSKMDKEFDCFWILTQDIEESIKETFLFNQKNYFLPGKIKFKNVVPITYVFSKIWKINYDICLSLPPIYPECWQAFIVSKLRKKKIVIWDEEYYGNKSWKRNIIMGITNWINRKSDYVLIPTKKHMKYQVGRGILQKKLVFFPNVSNIVRKSDKSEILKIQKKYGIKNRRIILFSGRLIQLKGVQYLIEAYYSLINNSLLIKNTTALVIIGDGEYRKELEELGEKILKINGKVIFTGYIDNYKLHNFYELSYLGVIPSFNFKGRSDSCPLVFNEFGVFGKPIIVSNMVGASGFIEENKVLGQIVMEKSISGIEKGLKNILNIKQKDYDKNRLEIIKITKEYNNYDYCIQILKGIFTKI